MSGIFIRCKRIRVLSSIIAILIFLLNATLLLPAAGQDLYNGTVSYIQFNDDGSFVFQLSQKGCLLYTSDAADE